MAPSPDRLPQRSDALSRERIVAVAVEILDSDGERALTFRTLAARLATGAGAIYWHVPNKEALLEAATLGVIGSVVRASVDGAPGADDPDSAAADPATRIRDIALGVYDAVEAHPWVGGQLVREPWQSAGLVIFERLGRELQELGLSPRQQFDAATALLSLLLGLAGQRSAAARIVAAGLDREAFLGAVAERWRALDAAEYPFSTSVAAELPGHDDRAQFGAALDLVLAGVAALRA